MEAAVIQGLEVAQRRIGTAFGGVFGSLFAIAIEGMRWSQDNRRRYLARFDRLEAEIRAVATKAGQTTGTVGPTTSLIDGSVSADELLVQEKPFTALQTALATQLSLASVTVRPGAGASGSVALVTSGGTGEVNTLGNFALRINALTDGNTGPTTGVQARITPPVALKGPIRATLSAPPTVNSSEGLKPYYIVNYATDGVTVNSIDIGFGVAPTTANSYDIQVELYPAKTAATANVSSAVSTVLLHHASDHQLSLVNQP